MPSWNRPPDRGKPQSFMKVIDPWTGQTMEPPPVPPAGTWRVRPLIRLFGLVMPLALCRADTVVPNRMAMPDRVSPACTV